jgi:Tol biopolymer transport system component
MAYVGDRWGDDVIAEVFHGVASGGLEAGFRRALTMDLATLSADWHEAVRSNHVADTLQRTAVRDVAQITIDRERSGGGLHVSPALSPDGSEIAYFSEASSYSVNIYLADATSGAVKKQLVKSAFSANFESLRFLNSATAWSPDGAYLAFPAQRNGRDDIVIFDVERRKVVRRIRPQLAGITNPSWSPDGSRLVFTGLDGGVSDLFVVNVDGSGLQRLTDDRHGDLHPAWSPDGQYIAFATDRSPQHDFPELRPGRMVVALFDMHTRSIEVLPTGSGDAINPQWSPDGDAVAFVSDQTGIANVFLYDRSQEALFQITDVFTGVSGITPTSPAISWARDADRLAITYYENGEYNIYTIEHPRDLKREVPAPSIVAAELNGSGTDRAAGDGGTARSAFGSVPRAASRNGTPRLSVKALLDSATLVLPDTNDFGFARYSPKLLVDYFAQPQVGYVRDNFGSGVYGGAGVALSDIMGSRRLLLGGQINGHLAESQFAAIYANMAQRTNWAIGVQQSPYFLFTGADLGTDSSGQRVLTQRLQRFIVRRAFVAAQSTWVSAS